MDKTIKQDYLDKSNLYKKNPIKLNIFNKHGYIKETYIFINNVDDSIKEIFNKLNNKGDKSDAKYKNKLDKSDILKLKKFYGRDWKTKLSIYYISGGSGNYNDSDTENEESNIQEDPENQKNSSDKEDLDYNQSDDDDLQNSESNIMENDIKDIVTSDINDDIKDDIEDDIEDGIIPSNKPDALSTDNILQDDIDIIENNI